MEQTFKGLSHLYNQSNFEIDLFEIFKMGFMDFAQSTVL